MWYRTNFFLAIILVVYPLLTIEHLLAGEMKAFVYESKGKRDPFVPTIIAATRALTNLEDVETVDELMLEGILWDARGDSIAMLNGAILKEGDKIGNIHILKITPRKVFLTIYEQKHEINLKEKGE